MLRVLYAPWAPELSLAGKSQVHRQSLALSTAASTLMPAWWGVGSWRPQRILSWLCWRHRRQCSLLRSTSSPISASFAGKWLSLGWEVSRWSQDVAPRNATQLCKTWWKSASSTLSGCPARWRARHRALTSPCLHSWTHFCLYVWSCVLQLWAWAHCLSWRLVKASGRSPKPRHSKVLGALRQMLYPCFGCQRAWYLLTTRRLLAAWFVGR